MYYNIIEEKWHERQKSSMEVNMKAIKRDVYLNRLISRKENGLIKIITGIRRCGKSYLLNEIFVNHLKESGVKEDHIIKLALDREENKNIMIQNY